MPASTLSPASQKAMNSAGVVEEMGRRRSGLAVVSSLLSVVLPTTVSTA
jgi:hypothetical protein